MDKVIGCITYNFANFSGRARRPEYWYFILFYFLMFVVTYILDIMTGLYSEASDIGVMSSLVSLGLLIPALAVGARRLHDINKTGWWQLIGIIPFIGGIVLLVLACLPGTEGPNRFGDDFAEA